jgi:hypothetical protein
LELTWNDQETHDALSRVSVLDRHCAAVYLTKETDVAFRPFGLDLFDRLSDASEAVRKVLDKEHKYLEALPLPLPDLPDGTEAYKLLSNITALTKPEKIKALGTLSTNEQEHMLDLKKRLRDLQADDPAKVARGLTLRADRLDKLASHLTKVSNALTDASLKQLSDARDILKDARGSVKTLRANTFAPRLLPGTGSDLWRDLWEAARTFSIQEAYPELEFPVTGEDAVCLLCQQQLETAESDRLSRLENFIRSTAQQELDKATARYQECLRRLEALSVTNDTISATIEELRIESQPLAQSIDDFLTSHSEPSVAIN